MFSNLRKIADACALNEKLGLLHRDSGALQGSGTLFVPMPGFYLGHCGPIKISSPFSMPFLCDEPVVTATLVLSGSCRYSFQVPQSPVFTLQKNMFLLGYWDNITVNSYFPEQENYDHIGFFFTKSSLAAYFGDATSKQICDQLIAAGPCGTLSGLAQPDVTFLARQAFSEVRSATATDLLSFRSAALNCFIKLIDRVSRPERRTFLMPHEDDKRKIAQLKEYIEQNFSTIEKAGDVCARFGMSFSKANKLFKALYSVTIAQYTQDHKMAYAYSMLVKRKRNVTECASEIGYTNISHFIASFKKRYNLTPKAASRCI